MDPATFTEAAPGRLVRIPDGLWAFVPHPLPEQLDLGPETIRALSDADRAIGRLAGVGQTLPNPHLLISPFLRREAVLSSRIEGTTATLRQLALFEAAPAPIDSDVQEVYNYVSSLEYGIDRLAKLPVSLRLFRELHQRLLSGVRGQERNPGEFRRSQNAIASRGQPRFVPPPVSDMTASLHELERYIAAPNDLPPLIQIALIHYQFEAIHPFMDGNGRVGRLLITLLLCERDLLPQPLLYLSAYFERNREAYMDRLLAISQRGEWTNWITFFLNGVTQQSFDAVARSQRLLALWQDYRQRLQAGRASGLTFRLLDHLFIRPAITVTGARKLLAVTPRAAQLNIDKLVQADILREVTGRPRYKLYLCPDIVDTVEGP